MGFQAQGLPGPAFDGGELGGERRARGPFPGGKADPAVQVGVWLLGHGAHGAHGVGRLDGRVGRGRRAGWGGGGGGEQARQFGQSRVAGCAVRRTAEAADDDVGEAARAVEDVRCQQGGQQAQERTAFAQPAQGQLAPAGVLSAHGRERRLGLVHAQKGVHAFAQERRARTGGQRSGQGDAVGQRPFQQPGQRSPAGLFQVGAVRVATENLHLVQRRGRQRQRRAVAVQKT